MELSVIMDTNTEWDDDLSNKVREYEMRGNLQLNAFETKAERRPKSHRKSTH